MKHFVSIVLLIALGFAGCRQHASVDVDDPWSYFESGDVLVTLRRWAVVAQDDEQNVYYVDFVTEKRVDDINIIVVRDLPELRYLDLSGTRVSDDGLTHLRGLEKLKILTLPDNISGIGLEHLKTLKSLQRLNVGANSLATSAEVDALRKALPNTQVTHAEVFTL